MITQELYEKLNAMLTNDQQVGEIVVKLANVRCKIKGKDAIGHLVQEWFFEWTWLPPPGALRLCTLGPPRRGGKPASLC